MYRACPEPHQFDPPGHSDSETARLPAVAFLEPLDVVGEIPLLFKSLSYFGSFADRRLASSSRGQHCRISHAVLSRLHAMLTQTGRLFSPIAATLDCKNSFHNSSGNASGLSVIHHQKSVIYTVRLPDSSNRGYAHSVVIMVYRYLYLQQK